MEVKLQNTLVVFKWQQWEIIPLSSRGVLATCCGPLLWSLLSRFSFFYLELGSLVMKRSNPSLLMVINSCNFQPNFCRKVELSSTSQGFFSYRVYQELGLLLVLIFFLTNRINLFLVAAKSI